MHPSTGPALAVAVPLALLGVVSGAFQVRGMRRLRGRTHVPSDEQAYLARRYRRRLFAAGIMVLVGALIGGAYLSGMEARADALGEPDPTAPRDEEGKRIISDEDRQFVRLWAAYWIVIASLAVGFIGIALTDAWASGRYWLGVYKQMKEDHDTKLRRDLAVHQTRKARGPGKPGYGGRLGS